MQFGDVIKCDYFHVGGPPLSNEACYINADSIRLIEGYSTKLLVLLKNSLDRVSFEGEKSAHLYNNHKHLQEKLCQNFAELLYL